MGKLDPLILEYQMMGDLSLPCLLLKSLRWPKASGEKFSVEMAYFYQKGCPKCDRGKFTVEIPSRKISSSGYPAIDLENTTAWQTTKRNPVKNRAQSSFRKASLIAP